MATAPLQFSFGSLRNSNLFSNHWLEHRLSLEPEWTDVADDARHALEVLELLWKEQAHRVELHGNEQGLEYAFIQPVLELLGWKLCYQANVEQRRPDYSLFLTDELLDAALQAGKKTPQFWEHATIVADAKAWHVTLDRPTGTGTSKEYPPKQIEWYLDHTHLDFGILTNGASWRLSPRLREHYQPRFQTFFEFNLLSFLKDWTTTTDFAHREWLVHEFLHFYLFFGPAGHTATTDDRSLVKRALEGGSEYRLGVGEGLKERAFEALRLCVEGLLAHPENNLKSEEDLDECRTNSFILLYRLLFIMYAEDRQLLPYGTNRLYTQNRSLRRLRNEIYKHLSYSKSQNIFTKRSTAIREQLFDLFDLVDRGHGTYGVPAYNGGLFDNENHPFLLNHTISDWYLARIIDQLSQAPDPEHPEAGLFRVDYRDLTIQHLGGIYEGLLELIPRFATEEMLVVSRMVKGQLVEKVHPASLPPPKGYAATEMRYASGSIYLETHKGERRASGSYYTPDHIVQYIVERTLEPICERVSQELENDIQRAEQLPTGEEREALLANLEQEFDDRILQLRILDPALGSGHFLIGACQYLAEQIATHPYTGDEAIATASDEESALAFWKRRIVERCLFGVDLNPLAVELAKLALWLETVAADKPLTFLDHHLHCGNSLVGCKLSLAGSLPGDVEQESFFTPLVEEKLEKLLVPLAEIESLSSNSTQLVRKKQDLYRSFERTREPFRQVADIWTSAFAEQEDGQLTEAQYQEAVSLVTKPRKFQSLMAKDWVECALDIARRSGVAAFHWELEFPNAFFEGTQRREDAGFDAIIGNPPYFVLPEKDSANDLAILRRVVDHYKLYRPSKSGKLNLYKLFVCRALDLLVDGGRLGFITPMPILGDEQAVGIRKAFIEHGTFTGIEAFPQKDNVKKRVFREAKLSTAIFNFQKSADDNVLNAPFTSRVHPENEILNDSPSLTLSMQDIPQYDPSNLTVVSCSQADWQLATRTMQSGRLVRLGTVCESFQGEVNETNEKKRNALSVEPNGQPLILRGSNVCMYAIREASQGNDFYICQPEYLKGKSKTSKAYHGLEQR